jgi:valyl-tRNA synthetase
LRAEGHTANCQLRQDLDNGFRNELEKMKDNELESITHQVRELKSGKNRRPTVSISTILQVSEREIQKQFEQQMQMGNDLLQTELFNQTVRLIKNCDNTCADIEEEYQKELTVFAQYTDKNLTGIRNTLLGLDTEDCWRGRQSSHTSNCDGRFGSFHGSWPGRRA